MSLLDTILTNHENGNGGGIVSENHDINNIKVDLSQIDREIQSRLGMWDAAEMGISREEVARRVEAAKTPEAKAAVLTDLKQRAIRRASLDTTNGRVNLMVAGEAPWHGLGVNVASAVDSATALRLAGMDWRVEKLPMSYQWNGQAVNVADQFALVRNDTGAQLSLCSKHYKPIDNADGFAFLDGVLSVAGARYESAGSLFGGQKVFMLAHLPQQRFAVADGDEVEPYVVFTNSHVPGEAARCFPTATRVVCNNTLNTASRTSRGKGISIRHMGEIKAKITSAQEALGLAVERFQQFKEDAATMVSTKVVQPKAFFNDVLNQTYGSTADLVGELLKAGQERDSSILTEAVEKFEKDRADVLGAILERYDSERCGVGGIRGTAWACLNAVTEYADHGLRYRGSVESRASRRFENVLTGAADDLKQVAYETAMSLAN